MESTHAQWTSFRGAVRMALASSEGGLEILDHSERFYAMVLDNCDPNAVELNIFSYNHDDALLRPFKEAAWNGSADELADAIEKGTTYLFEERVLERTRAQLLCSQLAAGIADYLKITLRAPALNFALKQAPTTERSTTNSQSHTTSAPHTAATMGPVNSASTAWTPAPLGTGSPTSTPAPSWSSTASRARSATGTSASGWSSTASSSRTAPPSTPAPKRSNTGWIIFAAALVAVIVGGVVFSSLGSQGSPASSTAFFEPEPVVFTVSFETAGGTTIDPQEIEEGDKVYSPTDPTRDGYSFVGWYRNKSLTKRASFPFTPKDDTILYAKWEKESVLEDAVTSLLGDGHTYALFDQSATWQEAESQCEELGGYLVTVTSRFEQSIVEDLISQGNRNTYWLGGYLAARDQWAWVTGEPFSYTNWSEGLPDNWIIEGEDYHATEEQRNDIAACENSLSIYRIQNPLAPQYPGEWNDLASNGECEGEEFFGIQNIGYVCEWDEVVE